ncbi:MAG: N-6 DNA methylase [Clostridia bacterium]|nr:N-6 DNA methylase [Clostridia bacterium]
MSEELIQKGYLKHGDRFGEYEYYNIGKTNFEDLEKHLIVPKMNWGKYKRKAPDALICDRRNKQHPVVICVIEYKQPSEFNTEHKKYIAFEQCNNYAQVCNAKICIITDGSDFYWLNPRANRNDWDYKYFDADAKTERGFSFIRNENNTCFKEYFDSTSAESINTIDLLSDTITEINHLIRPAQMVSPSVLAKKVWQSVYMSTGDDPKKCLMTFTELFIFKFLSDKKILKYDDNGNAIDFETVYDKGKSFCLKYYLTNVRPYIKKLFPVGEDGTTIINGLSLKKDQNQDELFFDVLKAFKENGRLDNIDPAFKSRLFEDFLKSTTGKKQLAQFFTPRNVVKAIVEMANVKNLPNGSSVCDPACGVGGFISEAVLNRRANGICDYSVKNGEILTSIDYRGTDYDELTIILAKANYLITLIELVAKNASLTEKFSKIFSSVFELHNKSIIGSLETVKEAQYDLIMSNPPYISSGKGLYTKYIDERQGLKKYYNTTAIGKEGLFLQKIIAELKPNGKAFVVLPDGFFYRPTDNDLKKKIISECFINGIISLPSKTFYATSKKTYILCLTKKSAPEAIQQTPVFVGLVSQIGETLDADRIPSTENDLLEISKEYKKFAFDSTSYQSSSARIKLIKFDKLESNLNWLVENYWSSNELVSLGVKAEERELTSDDMIEEINYIVQRFDHVKTSLLGLISEIKADDTEYKEFSLTDEDNFEFIPFGLGLTRKQYAVLDTKNSEDIPVYTAARKPVAYFNGFKTDPIACSKEAPLISFASDGDGTAGTNIFYHQSPFYINTSRRVFLVKNPEINPLYVYYYIQDMKKQYSLDFRFKANNSYLDQIVICVPVKDGKIDQNMQCRFIEYYKKLRDFKQNTLNELFASLNQFEDDIDHQLDKTLKHFLNLDIE